jgi:hypothetical protein
VIRTRLLSLLPTIYYIPLKLQQPFDSFIDRSFYHLVYKVTPFSISITGVLLNTTSHSKHECYSDVTFDWDQLRKR